MSEKNLHKYRNHAIISYMTILGTFLAIILNKDKNEYVNFHIRQSLGTFMILILALICLIVNPLLALIVYFIYSIMGIWSNCSTAKQHQAHSLIRRKFQQLFSK